MPSHVTRNSGAISWSRLTTNRSHYRIISPTCTSLRSAAALPGWSTPVGFCRGPRVRIPFPPARSQQRTLWLPGASHAGRTQSSNPLCSSGVACLVSYTPVLITNPIDWPIVRIVFWVILFATTLRAASNPSVWRVSTERFSWGQFNIDLLFKETEAALLLGIVLGEFL